VKINDPAADVVETSPLQPKYNDVVDAKTKLSYPVVLLENQTNCSSRVSAVVTDVEMRNESSGDDIDGRIAAKNENNVDGEPMAVDAVKTEEVADHDAFNLKRRLEEDDTSSNAEKKFNEDVLCAHGTPSC
jgi:hypothetical protein